MPVAETPLGIFGGTFDPVHFGHLRLAQEALESLNLGEVVWIPAGLPPHRGTPSVTAQQRLEMVQLAISQHPHFRLDRAEVDSPKASYTVHTLERLRDEHGPNRPLVLLVGADAFAGLTTWHRWQDILQLAHIGIAHRPGFNLDMGSLPTELASECQTRLITKSSEKTPELSTSPAGRFATFPMTPLAISATHIRENLSIGRTPRYLLPDDVLDYIARNHLYTEHQPF
jgi:nicotinate-nucleotide adenylyltransferase